MWFVLGMKYMLSGDYVIHAADKESKPIIQLRYSGLMSRPSRPHIGESMGIVIPGEAGTDDVTEDQMEVVDVVHPVGPEDKYIWVYTEDFCWDISDLMNLRDTSEAETIQAEEKWINEVLIPCLRKQGFTDFDLRKS